MRFNYVLTIDTNLYSIRNIIGRACVSSSKRPRITAETNLLNYFRAYPFLVSKNLDPLPKNDDHRHETKFVMTGVKLLIMGSVCALSSASQTPSRSHNELTTEFYLIWWFWVGRTTHRWDSAVFWIHPRLQCYLETVLIFPTKGNCTQCHITLCTSTFRVDPS